MLDPLRAFLDYRNSFLTKNHRSCFVKLLGIIPPKECVSVCVKLMCINIKLRGHNEMKYYTNMITFC